MKKFIAMLLFLQAFHFAAEASCTGSPVSYHSSRSAAEAACAGGGSVSYDVVSKVWMCVCWNGGDDD